MIHDGETRTIFKFSAKNFDSDYYDQSKLKIIHEQGKLMLLLHNQLIQTGFREI